MKNEACVKCGSVPAVAFGLCRKCYMQQYMARKRANREAAVKRLRKHQLKKEVGKRPRRVAKNKLTLTTVIKIYQKQ